MQTKERGTHDTGDGDKMIKQGQHWTPTFFGFRLGIPISCRPAAGAPSTKSACQTKDCLRYLPVPLTPFINVRTTNLHLISALTTRDDTDRGLPGIRSIDSSDFVVLARAYLPHYYKCVLNQTACWIYPYRSHNSGKRAYDQSSYGMISALTTETILWSTRYTKYTVQILSCWLERISPSTTSAC